MVIQLICYYHNTTFPIHLVTKVIRLIRYYYNKTFSIQQAILAMKLAFCKNNLLCKCRHNSVTFRVPQIK